MKLPEGESGAVVGRLTDERVEACAAYWGTPEKRRAESVIEFGKVWGLSAAKVREAKADPRVMARVEKQMKMDALYTAVEILEIKRSMALDVKHRDCQKAGNTVLEIAGLLSRTPGPEARVNVNVLNAMNFDDMDDEEVVLKARQILGQTPVDERPSEGSD